MNDKQTTRRKFLLVTLCGATAGMVGPSILRSGAAWAQEGKDDTEFLANLARQLFPHDGLADDVYADVMRGVLEQAASDPALAGLLADAEQALSTARDADWFDLGAAEQFDVLIELEGAPFFAGVRETVRFHLYYHPRFWEYIDYPGSSKEHGGYLYRGFNDIAWLPEGN